MGEGGQSLDMNAEQARERVGLGVTERRERGCDVLDRAMSLAQLDTGQRRARSDGSGGRGETVAGQRRRQCVRARRDVIARGSELPDIARFKVGIPFAGELAHGIGAGLFGKKTQRRGGHVVVVAVHTQVTSLGQDVCPGRPAPTAPGPGPASDRRLALLDGTLLAEHVKVTADRCRRQAQTRGQRGRGDRAVLGDRLPDPVSGPRPKTLRSGIGPVHSVGTLGTLGSTMGSD
jgi:hypothetical protein